MRMSTSTLLLLKNINYINNLLLSPDEDLKGYMEFFSVPKPSWKNGGIDRLEYYYLNTQFNPFTKFGERVIRWTLQIQKKLHFKRKIYFKEKLYGGSTYWTLPRNILKYVIDFTSERPAIYKRLHNTNVAEEFYFQTVLMNSIHAQNMINDSLRFMDWEEDGLGPAFLTMEYFDNLVNSNKLFARKIAANEVELLKKLKSQKDHVE